jgi:threonyl-tRNA synthetase
LAGELREGGMRVQVDDRSERMNLKIREAQLGKVPYMLVIGDKELDSSTVSLRLRNGEDLGSLTASEFMSRVKSVIEARAPDKL